MATVNVTRCQLPGTLKMACCSTKSFTSSFDLKKNKNNFLLESTHQGIEFHIISRAGVFPNFKPLSWENGIVQRKNWQEENIQTCLERPYKDTRFIRSFYTTSWVGAVRFCTIISLVKCIKYTKALTSQVLGARAPNESDLGPTFFGLHQNHMVGYRNRDTKFKVVIFERRLPDVLRFLLSQVPLSPPCDVDVIIERPPM